MTSRELLALAVIALPAVAAVLFLLAPRGLVTVLARLACCAGCGTCAGADGARPARLRRAGHRRLARHRRRRRAPRRRDRPRRARECPRLTGLPRCEQRLARLARAPAEDVLRLALSLLGDPAGSAARRQPGRSLAARRGDDRRVRAARRLQRPRPRARGGLEVPRPDLARARRRAARDRDARGRHSYRRARRALLAGALDLLRRQRDGPDRLPAPACRARGEDRLGASAQLAAGCPLGGTAARLRAPLRRAPAHRASHRLALPAGTRTGRRRATRRRPS